MTSCKQEIYARSCLIFIIFIYTTYVFFPGSYSLDTWNIYRQMTEGQYNDWHAPTLTWLWRQLYLLSGKFYSLYFLQMSLYWLFIFLLLVQPDIKRLGFCIGILGALLTLFIPQYIMKDAHHAIGWSLAVMLLLMQPRYANRNLKYILAVAAFTLLVYGLYVRINAVIAIVPLLFAGTWWLHNRWKQALLVTIVMAILLPANYYLTYDALSATRTYPGYKWKLLDIGGISKLSNENYFPASITSYEHFDYKRFMQEYSPASIDAIYWPKEGPSMLPAPKERLYQDVSIQWRKAIAEHPDLYLKNRWQGFLNYLRIAPRYKVNEYWDVAFWIEPANPLQLTYNYDAPAKRATLSVYKSLQQIHFFDPWVWLVLNAALAVAYYRAYKRHGQREQVHYLLLMLHLSAILYMLSQFFIYQHDRDFRYNYFSVLAFLIGIMHIGYLKSDFKRGIPE